LVPELPDGKERVPKKNVHSSTYIRTCIVQMHFDEAKSGLFHIPLIMNQEKIRISLTIPAELWELKRRIHVFFYCCQSGPNLM